jgi:hypothetical protein
MKKSLTSLILGTALALPIVSLSSKTYSFEDKAVATDSKLPSRDEFTFDDFKQALGKRYEILPEAEKVKIKENYKDKKFKYSSQYESLVYLCYAYPDALYSEDLPNLEKKEFEKFDIGKIDKKRIAEYYESFPWLKEKKAFQKKPIENNKINPDCLLIYYLEYPNLLKERLGVYDPLDIFKKPLKNKK